MKNNIMKNKIPTNHDEMIIHCSTFKELLDIENGNPGTPEQEQFNTDAAAFCVTETLKKNTLNIGAVTNVSELP